MGFFYLASPYSHPSARVRERRYDLVCRAAAHFARRSVHVYSPIAHWHVPAKKFKLEVGYGFWRENDEMMIEKARGIIVLTLVGWRESVGVTRELEWAESLKLPVEFIAPHSLD